MFRCVVARCGAMLQLDSGNSVGSVCYLSFGRTFGWAPLHGCPAPQKKI